MKKKRFSEEQITYALAQESTGETIGVDGKAIWVNTVCENCFPDKHGGERACFAVGKSPSNNTSGVQIKNDVEVVIATECGRKFSDVPSPNLVWSCRTKSWDLRLWMARNSAPFTNRLVLRQYSIHCSHRAQVSALG